MPTGKSAPPVVVDAKTEAVSFYSALGFKAIELVRGTLGDRPEPVAMLLSIRQIEAAVR